MDKIWPDNSDCAFAIRDDDVSYFTNPRNLEIIYKDAWKMGFKTSFAVIPYIRATYNLNVPPKFRGNLNYYLISENEYLVSYLRSQVVAGKVDILQHGFCHTEDPYLPSLKFDLTTGKLFINKQNDVDLKRFSEFYGLGENECIRRIDKGKMLLETTFNVKIKVFVPPQEYLSKDLWKCLKKENLYILGGCNLREIPLTDLNLSKVLLFSIHKLARRNVYPEDLLRISKVPCLVSSYKHYWNKYFNEKVAEYWFRRLKEEFLDCIKRKSFFILHTHYWEYFYDWSDEVTQTRMLEYLYRILEYVDKYNVWKCSVTELFNILNASRK
jgi:predicted deacetylase